MLFQIYDFSRKKLCLGENLHVWYTLFILYLEGNHTLFKEKIYFILKFSSCNTALVRCRLFIINILIEYAAETPITKPPMV